jgi:hypothetical protein
MKWLIDYFHWIVLVSGIYIALNGILHTFFVLKESKGFDKELIRLLIDGHILIFGGVLFMICYNQLKMQTEFSYWICCVNGLFLLGYCGLVFKLVPAVFIIILNLVIIALSIYKLA